MQASAWDKVVHVRMIDQVTGPGVKDGGDAGCGAETTGVGAQVQQRRGGGAEEEREQLTRVGADRAAQRVRHGEGGQMVRDRQQEGLLPVAPGVGVVGATSGAMAMSAAPVGAGTRR